MSIPVSCSCGQQFMAQPHLAGKQVACPNCGNPLSIPAPGGQPAEGADNVVTCACGRSFRAPPHLAGQRVPCPDCGEPIDIPAAGRAASRPAEPRPATAKGPAATKPKKPAAATPAPAAAPTPSDLMWDDALGTAPLSPPGGLPGGFPGRRVHSDRIEPMTMYAIWAGIAAVILLVLMILGHIVWNAFAGRERPEAADPATESAPADPQTPPPADDPDQSPAVD
jgi:predicted RNA-binding Zn-ribbon protein involved in translation (DUF1610 family)